MSTIVYKPVGCAAQMPGVDGEHGATVIDPTGHVLHARQSVVFGIRFGVVPCGQSLEQKASILLVHFVSLIEPCTTSTAQSF